MANAVRSGLCRVTIVAPRTRVDLAVPEDVPLAGLLPALLRMAGEDLADDGAAHGGWALSRLGTGRIDTSRTAAQLDLHDGDQLFLTPRSEVAPEAVFDDVIDAVATATRDRSGRWRAASTRQFSIAAAVVVLVVAAAVILTSGPPFLPGSLAALILSVVLLVIGGLVSRAGGDSGSGAALGFVAIGYAAVGGGLLLAGDRELGELTAADALVASVAMLPIALIAIPFIADQAALFLAAAVVAGASNLGAVLALLTDLDGAGAAAIVVSVALACSSMLPSFAYRLARLPLPSVPTGPEDLKDDTEDVDGRRVLRQSDDASRHLTGLLVATAVIVLVSEFYLATAPGWAGRTLCAVVALCTVIRARIFLGRTQRLPLLIAGVAGGLLLAVDVARDGGTVVRLGVVLGGLVLGAIVLLLVGLVGAGRRTSPVWGRALDFFEIGLIVAIVPLALAVCDVYGWIRGIRG